MGVLEKFRKRSKTAAQQALTALLERACELDVVHKERFDSLGTKLKEVHAAFEAKLTPDALECSGE